MMNYSDTIYRKGKAWEHIQNADKYFAECLAYNPKKSMRDISMKDYCSKPILFTNEQEEVEAVLVNFMTVNIEQWVKLLIKTKFRFQPARYFNPNQADENEDQEVSFRELLGYDYDSAVQRALKAGKLLGADPMFIINIYKKL